MEYCIQHLGIWNQGNRAIKAELQIVDKRGQPIDVSGTWSGKIRVRGETRAIEGSLTPDTENDIVYWEFVDADDADAGEILIQLECDKPEGPLKTDWFQLFIREEL